MSDAGSDAEGLRAAFDAHGGELLGFAARNLRDVHAGEEAVQETFVRAWRAWGRFDPDKGSLRGWLFAIERHVVIDMARSRALRPVVGSGRPTTEETTPDATERLVASWQVRDALDRLGPEHRAVLERIYFQGMSGPEVAEATGVPEGTVRSRLYYALRAMRRALEEAGWDG